MRVHGAMSWGWSSARGRVLARAGIGVLSWFIPPGLVDDAVGDGLAWEMRLRALPARLGVYFVLGCALLSAEPYGEVIRRVTAGLEQALAAAGWQVPATTALTGVRRRIGEKPLESLFRRVCPALSPGRAAWSHAGGLLVVAVDGTTVSAHDSPPNAEAFGRPGTGKKRRPARNGQAGTGQQQAGQQDRAAGPQLRLVTLLACGTRAVLDAAIAGVRGKGTGEQALARQLLRSLHAGMLLLADRNFYGYQLWNDAARTGADLLWRVKASLHLPVLRELPDGSFLAHVNDPRAVLARTRRNGDRRRRGSKLGPETGPLPGITVRVIEFWLTVAGEDGAVRTERYRLITTLLDHRRYPAAELAACYAWRWAVDRVPRMQDLPARPRPGPARPHPGPGPPGTLGLPGRIPGHPGHHRPRRRRRRDRPRPDLLHRRAARHPADHGRRPRPGRRPGRGRNRDPGLPAPPAPGPHLPPRREQAVLALPVQAQPRRPHITTRQLHHHHHRTRPPHPNQH